ncbi:MAG: hypothetical protein M3Y86_11210 [Verrucomicrobiota bacterium]|nr:hypothetical protein [Verrucomicrobiota bacterium]
MKTKLILIIVSLITMPALFAGTAEQEKAFVDGYKAAFEAGDKAKLESYLYTEGANPMALEFYKMMQAESAGKKITKIELVDLSPEDVKRASEMQPGPGGQKMKLSLKPTKKLKITVETKDENGSSSSSSENFVAEKDGKYYIPVPANAK